MIKFCFSKIKTNSYCFRKNVGTCERNNDFRYAHASVVGNRIRRIDLYLDKKSEPPHDKSNNMKYALSEDSAQPVHQLSLIREFAVRFMGS